VNILASIGSAKKAFAIAGRGCLVRLGEDEPRYATVAEIAARLEPHEEATMLVTAVSEAVERYDPRVLSANSRAKRMGLRRRATVQAGGLYSSQRKRVRSARR
jgi:hypothetical protein